MLQRSLAYGTLGILFGRLNNANLLGHTFSCLLLSLVYVASNAWVSRASGEIRLVRGSMEAEAKLLHTKCVYIKTSARLHVRT
jgi:hypothetical protein